MSIEIQVRDNGPYLVRGEAIVLHDAAGNAWNLEGKENIALCRCGHSANKPFCDGSHKASEFQSECKAE